ncbi:CLAVATA3/ESR (CLE)-related protein 7 [Chenopodium quinoa]|uniref:CLAVATA3/ESR (CLE)-related protein 7 n=1 Tax=Chenopodium quinoa TaxID=63459 RepID=UPI000B79584C|nr:CLAVATA3/ESR (CLE)-related protein 7 [Chenopodium quinoa]
MNGHDLLMSIVESTSFKFQWVKYENPLLVFFLILSALTVLDSRLLPTYGDKMIDSKTLLRKLGVVAQEFKHNLHEMAVEKAVTERHAPDGPDPQHHFIPSAKP